MNQPPTVTLTQAPATTTQPYFYAYEIFWTGYDPDGAVDHYEYAVDPPTRAGQDTAWVRTIENRHTFLFSSTDADSLGTRTNPGGFHVFVIRAVDNLDARSPVVAQAFFSYTVAPTVKFVRPVIKNPVLWPILPPTTTMSWTGDDPDGQTSRKPVKYRYKLFYSGGLEFDFLTILTNPDSLRHYYAERNWAGWDSISADTCRVTFTHLIPGANSKYVLAVIAIDEAGAYSPVFSLGGNLMFFYCQYPYAASPVMSVSNDYFSYSQGSSGCFCDEPQQYVNIEVPWHQPISFQWSAGAYSGNFVEGYRWALDIDRLDDETPRTDASDTKHWSFWTRNLTGATVGPFEGGTSANPETHLFYVEAEDDAGLQSLVVVRFAVLKPTFGKPLLIVNDTRFAVDPLPTNGLIYPQNQYWPDAAELDTFLFARGNVPWRYASPAGTLSWPGVFRGYAYDTIGTRGLRDGVPLATLANYQAVVWFTDPATQFNGDILNDASAPMPILAYMSDSIRSNPLITYARMGGQVWVAGGGIAYNTQRQHNVTSNDLGGNPVYSALTHELGTGRFLYAVSHWRSQVTTALTAARTGRYRASRNTDLRGAWPGAPDYGLLPAALQEAEDPDQPDRTSPMRYSNNYRSQYDAEMITAPNQIFEGPDSIPVLDTLYWTGDTPGEAVMTLYHGSEAGRVVHSGFPPWFFHRDQCIQVTDFVLQQVFHLPRAPLSRDLPPAGISAARLRSAPPALRQRATPLGLIAPRR